MKKNRSYPFLLLLSYFKYYVLLSFFYIYPMTTLASTFNEPINEDNWQSFLDTQSDKINIAKDGQNISAIYINPIKPEDLFKKKLYTYSLMQAKEIYITNNSHEPNNQTFAIQLVPQLNLGDEQQIDTTLNHVEVILPNNTKINSYAQQGQAIGIQAGLSFQFYRSKEIEANIGFGQLLTLGTNNQLSVKNQQGKATALDIFTLVQFNENLPDTQPAIIYSDISTDNVIMIGEKSRITADAFAQATGININNQIDTLKSIPVMNRTMHHPAASNLVIGNNAIIRATSIANDAIAIQSKTLLNYKESTSILSSPFPRLQNIRQKSILHIGENTQIEANAIQGSAAGIAFGNAQMYYGNDIAGLDFSISKNSYLSQITTQQNVKINVDAKQQAIGILLIDDFNNKESISDRFGDQVSSEVILELGEKNQIDVRTLQQTSYAVQLINKSYILPKTSEYEYQGTSSISAKIGESNQLVSQSEHGKSYGLYINNEATLIPIDALEMKRLAIINTTLANNVAITSRGYQQAYGVYMNIENYQLVPENQYRLATTLNLEGDLDVYSFATDNKETYAFYLRGHNTTLVSNNPGRYRFIGQIVANDNALIDLHATSDSTMLSDLIANHATIKMTMAENAHLIGSANYNAHSLLNLSLRDQATWLMTRDSALSLLDIQDQVNIYLSQHHVGYNTSSQSNIFNKLTVNSLNGRGNIWMNADLDNANKDLSAIDETTTFKDFLYVTEHLNGNYVITMPNQANYQGDADNIVLIRSDDIASDGTFLMANGAEFGGYIYNLKKITRSASECHNNRGCHYWALSSHKKPSTTVRATVNSINAGYLLTYAETQTNLQRFGQLHNNKHYQGDIWFHSFAGGINAFDASPMLEESRLKYRGFQLGADKQVHQTNNVQYIGTLAGLSTADLYYKLGEGSLRNWHFGFYDTLLFNNQIYIDILTKYTQMTHHYQVDDSLGNKVNGKVHTRGVVGAMSIGKQIHFYDYTSIARIDGFYFEPQAQFNIAYNDPSSYRASNGLKIAVDDYLSTLGKLSITLGYHKENRVTPTYGYITFSYLNEMSAKTDFTFNDRRHRQKFTGTWYILAIGMHTEIYKRNTLYIDLQRSEGNRFNHHQINAGYRLRF